MASRIDIGTGRGDQRSDGDRDRFAHAARIAGSTAICRDDPNVAVVLLNQVVLRRYLEETVVPVAAAIREATRDAIDQI
jgi:hypothetical protein